MKEFDRLQQEFIETCFEKHPDVASHLGFTEYDEKMPSGKLNDRKKEIEKEKYFLKRFQDINESQLDFDRKITRKLAIHKLNIWIFVDETLKHYLMNPDAAGEVASSLHALFKRQGTEKFYPLYIRMERAPQYIEDFKTRAVTPVRLWTEMAVGSAEGLLRFLPIIVAASRKEVPHFADDIEDAAKKVEKSLLGYTAFLKDIFSTANTSWVMGRERFEELLTLRKIPYTADQIVELGENWIKKEREKLWELAPSISPEGSIDESIILIKSHHGETFEEILESYRASIKKSKEFVIDHDIVTIPAGETLVVEETPEHLRFMYPMAAYLPAPALGERIGHYEVTPPENQKDLREHNESTIANMSVHEAYPGHHIQIFCSYNHLHKIRWGFTPTDVYAKYVSEGTEFVEGWAHYCEEYMIEKGFNTKKEYVFMQSLHTLFRAVRMVADVHLARGDLSIDEAASFLERETGLQHHLALGEVKRYTLGPSYPLSYLVGKYMIKQLKEKVKEMMGSHYKDKRFHDTMLYEGTMPIALLEEIFEYKMQNAKQPHKIKHPSQRE